MRYYPLFLDLTNARCLVAGAGSVGRRKIRSLLSCPVAEVTIMDRQPAEAIPDLADILSHPAVRFEVRELTPPGSGEDGFPGGIRREDLVGRALVFAATTSPEVNAALAERCSELGVPCNAATAPHAGSFLVPAVARSGPLTLALSTEGASPALARALKQDLEKWLGERYSRLVCLLEALRAPVLALKMGSDANADFFRRLVALRDPLADALNDGDAARCEMLIAPELPPGLSFSFAEWIHELD